MEYVIVALIVAAAAGYIGRLFFMDATKGQACGCSCSGCGAVDQCAGKGLEDSDGGDEKR